MNWNHTQRQNQAFFPPLLSHSCLISIQMPELLGNTLAAEELEQFAVTGEKEEMA